MSELEKQLKKIEELRISLIKIKEGKSFTDPEVIAVSQMLDEELDKYHEMLMIINQRSG